MEWFDVLFIAIVIETITELFKLWFPEFKTREWLLRVFTILLGILICISCGVDMFLHLGITNKIPFLGCIITGLVVAGGSNIIYDIINKIRTGKNINGKEDASSDDVNPNA